MKHYSELSPLEKKAREASGGLNVRIAQYINYARQAKCLLMRAILFICPHLKPGIIPVKKKQED